MLNSPRVILSFLSSLNNSIVFGHLHRSTRQTRVLINRLFTRKTSPSYRDQHKHIVTSSSTPELVLFILPVAIQPLRPSYPVSISIYTNQAVPHSIKVSSQLCHTTWSIRPAGVAQSVERVALINSIKYNLKVAGSSPAFGYSYTLSWQSFLLFCCVCSEEGGGRNQEDFFFWLVVDWKIFLVWGWGAWRAKQQG